MSFELHPDTPPGGVSLAEYFGGRNVTAMQEYLRRAAAAYDLPFTPPDRLSNTRLAIEASEFARDQGRHEAFSRGVFAAYFVAGENIGSLEVLVRIAEGAGLDGVLLREALDVGACVARREAAAAEARRLGVNGVPTFFFPHMAISGAQPLETFRRALEGLDAAARG